MGGFSQERKGERTACQKALNIYIKVGEIFSSKIQTLAIKNLFFYLICWAKYGILVSYDGR
ncbi:MAG: hypothetical protein KR126chlam1_00060 [Chlamydiae bacterium]|nr:hypothetical protein [Chlamydiota bacterium]